MSAKNRTIPTDDEIEATAQDLVAQHVDPRTGEVNCTHLAEDVAHTLGHSEWLDDQDHDVWHIALDVAAVYEQACAAFAE